MKYSAGIMSHSFWYLETKNTAEYLAEDISKKELMELSLIENIYQVDSERRARELVLISILRNDKLFFEFMHEVFREHIILGNYTIKDSDLDIFFMNKSNQSEVIENWKDTTLRKVKTNYKNFLIEAGLLEKEEEDYKIILPFVDFKLKELLTQNNLTPFLNAISGGI